MLKKIFFLVCILNTYQLFSISIADFTVKYQKNGKYFNFYDDPALLFELLDEQNYLADSYDDDSYDFQFKDCIFTILSHHFEQIQISPGTLKQAENDFGIKNPNHYNKIYRFEALRKFSTIRGVEIGTNIRKVLENYPDAVLYKNNEKYKWEKSDCFHEEKLQKNSKISDIGYVLLEKSNWQYNRVSEVNAPMHYELVFVIKDCKVKSIVMQYVLDAM